MIKEEDISQVKNNISIEFFETFDADKQLSIINRLETVLVHLRALEDDFPPKYMEELIQFLEGRIGELQIIYNMKTNRTLNDFFK
jgi:hypothetical protein